MRQSQILDYIGSEGGHRNGIIRLEYSPYAKNHVRRIGENGINDQAVKRRYEEGISIDGVESLDLDDAIWAEKTRSWYAVFVHISDVTEAITPYSPLDIEALRRTTSIYRREGVVNMLPPTLSQDLLSLNENGEKLTLSIRIDLDHDTQIVDCQVYESVFKNLRRYDYESFVDDYMNPESEHHETLQLFYEIAKRRKTTRKRAGANMDYDESDRQLSVGEKEEKAHSVKKAIPHSVIEEFMILANIASATIAAENEYDSIFRLHKGFEERAYYHNSPGGHAFLALGRYTHFTSPIRRYADMIVHRVLKLVHLRGEKPPYTPEEISDVAKHVNVSRAVIEILWRDLNREMRGQKIVSQLKKRNGGKLNVSHFTQKLREMVWAGQRIPEVVVKEIAEDLENGEKSNWAWAIGVLLVSGNEEIKKCLKKALLDDRKFRARAVLALLNTTKVTASDKDYLFSIVEKEVGNEFSITVHFRGEKVLRSAINYGKIERNDAIGKVRGKILNRILRHFCGE